MLLFLFVVVFLMLLLLFVVLVAALVFCFIFAHMHCCGCCVVGEVCNKDFLCFFFCFYQFFGLLMFRLEMCVMIAICA